MAFNNNLFIFISLCFLVFFPAKGHRSLLPLLQDPPSSAPDSDSSPSSDTGSPAPASTLSTLKNAIVSSISSPSTPPSDAESLAPAPSTLSTLSNAIASSISFAPFSSPSLAPSPFGEEDDSEYDESLHNYLGYNVEVEYQSTITTHVKMIVNDIKDKTIAFIHGTIDKRLADSDGNENEKKCLYVCKSDYEDLSNDVTEVLTDFSMTHNFEMVSDYLHGLSYDVQSCKNCRAEISLQDDPDFNKIDDWLTAMGKESAAHLNSSMHA